jgi:L-ribulose-5-phosphate 3-epimerase
MRNKIGFMQGRLSAQIDGKIQAFPWPYWQDEFALSSSIGLGLMEWTLDQDRIYENPLMTDDGRRTIRALGHRNGVNIPSLTGDCFMQAPFWKEDGAERAKLVSTFRHVLEACSAIDIRFVVVPLVDNGALETREQQRVLEETLIDFVPLLKEKQLVIVFESDFPPPKLAAFIERLPLDFFGLNFDMGNSASLGWDPEEEISILGSRIFNVHVKDRVLGGTTVPLGQGNVNFSKVFALLRDIAYPGNLILQTARASDGNHAATLARYADFVASHVAD